MTIAPQCGPMTYNHISESDKEMLVLHNPGHGLVVDSERDPIFQKVYEWIGRHHGQAIA